MLFRSDDDDKEELFWKRMLRSAVLGPVNGIMIARDIANVLYNAAFLSEEAWMAGTGTPVLSALDKTTRVVNNLRKYVEDDEIDMAQVTQDILAIGSMASGLPGEQGYKVAKRVKEGIEEGNIAKGLGYPPYLTGSK